MAVDPRGRVWVAYEERTPNWGKDAVNLLDGKGSSLYRTSQVVVACVEGGRVLRAPDPVEHAPALLKNLNSYPRLTIDRSGRPWLAFRHRQESIWGNNAVLVVGAVWVEHATTLSGSAWSPPQPLTRSDGLLDNRPALVQPPDGPVLAFYSTDGRLRREVEMTPERARRYFANQGTAPGVFNVDLEVSALVARRDGPGTSFELSASSGASPAGARRRDRRHRPDAAISHRERRQDLSPAARGVPPSHGDLRGRRCRWHARGHVAICPGRRPARLDRQRRPRQWRRQGIHLVADSEDDRPVQPAADIHADVHL